MRGTILHYDGVSGLGHISGDDNNRYTFTRSDINPASNPAPGMFVDFVVRDGTATEIFAVPGGSSTATAAASASASAPPSAPGVAEPELSFFGYFVRGITSHYFRFSGRARRKEFWSFVLGSCLLAIIPAGVFVAGIAESDLDGLVRMLSGGVVDPQILITYLSPVTFWGVAMLGILCLLLVFPSMAVTVRRFHDVGLSGWLYVLVLIITAVTGAPGFDGTAIGFIPEAISLVIIVVAIINSKPGANKWGPNPKGQ